MKRYLWLSLLLLVGACAKTTATNPGMGTPPARSGLWSDPATWNGKPPQAGDTVTIPADLQVTLDVNPPALKGLNVLGWLSFADKDLSLSADWIMIHGRLQIGSADRPYTKRAILTLTATNPTEDVMGMGTKGIGVMMGGVLEVFGEPRNGWTRLTATAPKGATQISVENAGDWRVGDRIVLASTDYSAAQAEERSITGKNGNTLTLDAPLKYLHFGQITAGVDERGEVGLLSRNITIQGDASVGEVKDNSNGKTKPAGYGFGGHVMVMSGAQARISGVEFYRMGQKGKLGRYPLHWHLAGDVKGQYLKNSSIWNSFNRCVTLHGTQNAEVSGNVAYADLGHCYFLEDGAETGNLLVGNLGLLTLRPQPGEELIPTDSEPATYWVTHPANTLRNNVAAGSDWANGFWLAFPKHPTGASRTPETDRTIWPDLTPLGEFSGNVAHSNSNGLMVDRGPDLVTLKPRSNGTVYNPRQFPDQCDYSGAYAHCDDSKNPPVVAEFKNFTGYKNRSNAIWLRGLNHKVTGAKLADNAIGVTFASDATTLEDSLIVGTSDNKGQAESWEKTAADGRTLPRPYVDNNDPGSGHLFPIRGYEFYDGTNGFKNVSFVNFQPLALADGSTREAGALSYLRFTDFNISPQNFAQGARFTNAKPVYFPPRGEPTPDQVAKEDHADGYRGAVFTDRDGSVSGMSGRSVVINTPFLLDSNCVAKPDWNAQVCDYPYGRLFVENVSNEDGANVALAPISLTRLDGSNPVYRMWGVPEGGVSSNFQASLIAGRTYGLGYTGSLPGHLRITLRYRKRGDFVRVNLPFSGTPNLYRDYYINNGDPRYCKPEDNQCGGKLRPKASLADLEASTTSAYFYDGSTLYLKLRIPPTVSQYDTDPNRDWAGVEICRSDLCK